MKSITFLLLLTFSSTCLFAQKDSFDLVTYSPPKDSSGRSWQKEVKENTTSYTITNKITKSWCQIIIVKSTISKGNIEQDFESEWQGLIVKSCKPTVAAEVSEVQETEGWKIKTGGGKFTFNKADAMALLTTATGYNRCVSIVATSNSQDYIKDIEALLASVDLKKPAINTQPSLANDADKNFVIGTWGTSESNQSSWRVNNGIMSYIKRQYTFNADGTYTFISKTFDPFMDKILLGKENGNYQISGNTIIVIPKRSVLQAWSKKNGTDAWGKLVNSQSITLEKATYQFTKHYFSGIKEWNLVLQAGSETKRDGRFNGGTAFSKAWLYGIPCNQCLINLPE